MSWAVIRINDDGRREIVNRNMCALAAEKVAGALRDASTEAEIAAGWNYLPSFVRSTSMGLVVDPERRHVQTPPSDSRAPGATHLPVGGGHNRVRGDSRTGVRRMQVPSEPHDVHTPTAGRSQTVR